MRSALHPSDLRGLADLAVQATREVTAVVEGVHDSVHGTLGLSRGSPPGRTSGITGLVYRSIDGITRLTGAGIGACLALAEPRAQRLGPGRKSSRERDALLGVLNGIFGDGLDETRNPLAIPMTLYYQGREIDLRAANSLSGVGGDVLVMIHGLCMTEHGWIRPEGAGPRDMGAELAAQLGLTPVYLRYNSGRAVSANGLELAEQLETLLGHWPVPVKKLTLMGHSMGGLVARSAMAHGQLRGHSWVRSLDRAVLLGTPLLGAPLERAGAWVDSLLSSTPYTRPFTALTRRRSRGIRDLRHGETQTAHRDAVRADPPSRQSGAAHPFPEGVDFLAIAGTRSKLAATHGAGGDVRRLAGDGLVPVASALGWDPDPGRDLGLPDSSRLVLRDHHHMDLLTSQEVARSVYRWLSGR